jgi:hypothetical protein
MQRKDIKSAAFGVVVATAKVYFVQSFLTFKNSRAQESERV